MVVEVQAAKLVGDTLEQVIAVVRYDALPGLISNLSAIASEGGGSSDA